MTVSRPDVVVAVDFGTTYTGVAWVRPESEDALKTPLQVIQQWPGESNRNEKKVHTCLVYNTVDETLSSWGFLCDDEDLISDPAAKSKHEFFKVFLDRQTPHEPHDLNGGGSPASISDAQRLVSDFLRQIYAHIKTSLELHAGISHTSWKQTTIEFRFCVPTTWRTQDTINAFKTSIHAAGFGTEGYGHTATVELTESEAAAVGTIKSSTMAFESGDVFLSIDAGGGTTDLALMEVIEPREPYPTLSQISQVDGIGIGSMLIDQAFVAMVEARISAFPELNEQLPPGWVSRLVSGRFQDIKHKFGEKVHGTNTYRLYIEGVPFGFNHPGARIEKGKLTMTREEMESLFKPQVDKIIEKVKAQLNWMDANKCDKPIRYVILSGGLGSSAYVRDRLKQHILSSSPHLVAPGAEEIRQSSEPQLVVVKGLLLDRLQSLDSKNSTPVITSRVARASYGYVHRVEYNREIHPEHMVKKDPYDKKLYALGQIAWLIRKGDRISISPNNNNTSPIMLKFQKKVKTGDSTNNKSWDSLIMISDLNPDRLPRAVNEFGAQRLCTVTSDLGDIPSSSFSSPSSPSSPPKEKFSLIRRKNKSKENFHVYDFEVRVVVAPADIRFELWFKNQRFSKTHRSLEITWE